MPKKEVSKNDKKEKKENKHFFKDFKAELKRVIWPTPKQVVNNTIAVITIVLITAVIVFVLDLIFDIFNEQGINRLKSNIKNSVVIENSVDNNDIDAQNADINTVNENNETSVEENNNQDTVENESSVENVQ